MKMATVEKPKSPWIDVRSEPEFEELQNKVREALSVVIGANAEWDKIVALASAILETKSKDLLVAGYLAIGLSNQRKLDGFIQGCNAYLDVIESYWDAAYPPLDKPSARVRTIEWWVGRSDMALRAFRNQRFPLESTQQLLERCKKANQWLSERLESAPSLGPIIERLECALQKPDPVPASMPATLAVSEPIAVEAELATDADAMRAMERIAAESRRLSTYLQSRDAADPRVFRLSRLAYWFDVDELPPSEKGRTQIAEPDASLTEHLAGLEAKRQWPALLEFAEDTAHRFIFWLDLQRAAAEALNAMGDGSRRAADAVCRETAAFLRRLPGIERLSFANGTAFANPKTLAWLSALDGGSSQVSVAQATDLEDIRRELEPLKKKTDELWERLAQFDLTKGSGKAGLIKGGRHARE